MKQPASTPHRSGLTLTRDFTVATFVVDGATVLLLFHRKLQMWLPPGGHIEPNELPDVAALREVEEETGIQVRLLAERPASGSGPLPLARPEGIQLEQIAPNHQHIDLIYFAVPVGETTVRENPREGSGCGWYALDVLPALGATDEVQRWAGLAVYQVQQRLAAEQLPPKHCPEDELSSGQSQLWRLGASGLPRSLPTEKENR